MVLAVYVEGGGCPLLTWKLWRLFNDLFPALLASHSRTANMTPKRVALKSIKSLTFQSDKETIGRRTDPIRKSSYFSRSYNSISDSQPSSHVTGKRVVDFNRQWSNVRIQVMMEQGRFSGKWVSHYSQWNVVCWLEVRGGFTRSNEIWQDWRFMWRMDQSWRFKCSSR
jgi:hypothetical protein